MHSFEEDHDGVVVYRPADYPFPAARGREGMEFQPDGTYVDWTIGRGDAQTPQPGRWQPAPGNRLQVSTASGHERILEVVRLEPDRLQLRVGGAG
jgi:hypothetical protein